MIPLTTACLRALPLHTIRQLVAACPRRALTHPANENGQLPLHAACSTHHTYSLETVLYLICEYPDALQVFDGSGHLPLHLAARFASLQVIQAVYHAWPTAIQIRTTTTTVSSSSSSSARSRKKRTTSGQQNQQYQQQHQPQRLPFHLAMQEKRDASIISFLLSKYPAAVRMPDDDDNADVLVTSTTSAIADDIDGLTTTTTSTTATPLSGQQQPVPVPVVAVGKLPLQLAIEQNASLEIIQCLVQVDRDIMSLPDNLGNLPLHCALLPCAANCGTTTKSKSNNNSTSNASVYNRLVLYLLRQGPKNAAQIPNAAGHLPLHLACARSNNASGTGCSLSIIAALVRQNPGALRVADAAHGQLPLHWAILNRNTSSDDKENYRENCCNNRNDESSSCNNALLDLVQLLVRPDSQTLQVQDPDGCLALHFALHRHNVAAAAAAASRSSTKTTSPPGCACQCYLQLIDYLLDQYPQACRVANPCNGQLPLHMIADVSSTSPTSSHGCSIFQQQEQQQQQQQQQHYYYSYNHQRQLLLLQLIHKIVQRFPNALYIKDAKGCLPMTLACYSQAPLAILECLASSSSTSSSSSSTRMSSPLLFSCAHLLSSSSWSASSLSPSLSLKILQFILAQSPDNAISSPAASNDNNDNGQDYRGGLPLHIACSAGASPAVIEYIVRQFESAVAIADGHGRLPLHCACSSILSVTEKNAAAKNDTGKPTTTDDDMVMMEMEMIIQNSCQVMEYLLRVFPAAAAIVDHNGCLPLHHLAVTAAAVSSTFTSSSHVSNNNNNNNGKMSTSLLRIAKLLVQENAGALVHRNHDGYCPWLLAAMSAETTTATSSGNNSRTSRITSKIKETDGAVATGTADPGLDVLFYLAQQSPSSILPLVVARGDKSNVKFKVGI